MSPISENYYNTVVSNDARKSTYLFVFLLGLLYSSSMDYLQRAKSFRTKKRLGQNFLISQETIDAIIEHAQISKDDIVIEIGAGMGFVTEQLVKHAKKVIAIELDEDAIRELKKIPCDNLEIIHQDILKTDLSELVGKLGFLPQQSRVGSLTHHHKVKIVANIPYYITSPIIAHLLGEIDDLNNANRNLISDIILMVQYEVAQRIVATEKSPSKQYGLLTILSQFWADCEIIKKVGRKCFYPAPKVDSALVKMVVRQEPKLKLSNYSHFRRTIKAAFSQRRKNIKNCLLSGGFPKENVQKSLETLGITENTRGETISIEQFGKLSEELLSTSPLAGEVCFQCEQEMRTLENRVRGEEIKVKCPAKINLTLEILNKREDGFHNIQSIMQTINLFDILTIKIEKSDEFAIKLTGTSSEIPYDERNLVYKAIILFFEQRRQEGKKARRQVKKSSPSGPPALLPSLDLPLKISVHIQKNIPIAAGLAGGSTDAAGTLWGLNKLFNNVLSNEELHELCAKLGSDLNFCLEGGCQLATSRGEILEKLPFQEFRLSLIKPKNLGISAKEAYTKFSEIKLQSKPDLKQQSRLGLLTQQHKADNALIADNDEFKNITKTEKLVKALKSACCGASLDAPCNTETIDGVPYSLKLEEFLHNDLEIALIEDYQELKQIKTAYPNSLMSGSGSTFFVLEDNINNINKNFWLKTGLKSIPYGVSEL